MTFETQKRKRPWAVIARDLENVWRHEIVMAYDMGSAIAYYDDKYPTYEAVGAALAYGSGKPIYWIYDSPPEFEEA